MIGNLYWAASNGEFNSSDNLPQSSRKILQLDGTWKTISRPLTFDYVSLIPDTSLNWDVEMRLFDVDGDARPDLVVRVHRSGMQSITWLRNISGGTPLVADINSDGRVNGIDLGLLLGDWTG